MTRHLDPDETGLKRAAEMLRRGGLVSFPTETVYGLGGDASDDAAVARIYPDNKVKALARNQTWRDVGAAAGPLATGAGLAFIAPEMMHIFVSAAFVVAFFVFVMSPGWRAVTRAV